MLSSNDVGVDSNLADMAPTFTLILRVSHYKLSTRDLAIQITKRQQPWSDYNQSPGGMKNHYRIISWEGRTSIYCIVT